MPAFEHLLYDKQDGIATVTIHRPLALNALSHATLDEIDAAMADARADDTVRGVIVTGAGEKAFVAGADISEMAGLTPLAAEAFTRRGQAVMDGIEQLGKPVVAAVNGFALGGGCELAMACTLRIAAVNASFGQPEVRLGILPGFGGTQRLPRLVGKGRAMRLILSAETIDAQEALCIGLVDEVVESGLLMERARGLLRRIGANAPVAVRLAMEAVNRGLEAGLEQGLAIERASFAICASTADQREGVSAFLAKRAPAFMGA